MASPQKEHGYTAIANELIEAFMRLNLSPYSWRILFCIIRYSYGWNKKTAQLRYTQLARLTGIDARLISRTLKNLIRKNIITRDGNTFSLQKDYHKWVTSAEMTSAETKNYICRDVKNYICRDVKNYICRDVKVTSVEMLGTGKKHNNIKNLQGAKDIPKDIFKEISLRETLLRRLKTYFPDTEIPAAVPDKRIDFFLYLIEQGRINPALIEDPVRYIQSRKLVVKPFPSLLEREAEKERIEREKIEKLKRDRAELERQRIDPEAMKGLISSFMAQLEGKCAVAV